MPGKSKRVDPYYERDGIVLHHGDNIEVMSQMPSGSIDLVVTSPPYDNLRTYGGHTWDFDGVASQLWRLVKPGGVVVWVVADATVDGSETGTSFRQALRFMEVGFRLHDTMIWNKYLPGVYGKRYVHAFEYMFVFSSGEPSTFNPVMRKNEYLGKRAASTRKKGGTLTVGSTSVTEKESVEENVWRIQVGGGRKAQEGSKWIDHPAMFPEKLVRDHVTSWSNVGDVVLDPFNGSGTTTKIARETDRRGIGIDVSEAYCEVAANRLKQGVLSFID